LAAAFIAFTVVSSAKGVQTSRHQLPTAVLMDGPGPMCPPDSGCAPKYAEFASGEHFTAAVLLGAGPGPMCLPDTGCGYRFSVQTGAGKEYFPAAVLLADGPGPMCFPGVGCGYRNDETNMLWPS
jgi:hypothetical protein